MINRMLKISLFSLLILPLTSIASEQSCPNTKISCSCSESAQIFSHGLNNDPYKIETADIENLDLSDTCKKSIMEKMAVDGIAFSEIFKNSSNGIRFTAGSFLRFANNIIINKSIRKFPISDTKSAVCIPKGISRSQAAENSNISIEILPKKKDIDGIVRVDTANIKNKDCLVYLPNPYVAAASSGPDQELYPHDASYIISTLIKSGESKKLKLAKNLIENFIFEIENYGYPINGNRAYFLTRSQNNVIPTNIREYFDATKDYGWLENRGLPNAVKILEFLNTRIGVIDLGKEEDEDNMEGNRWFASGAGPRPEVWGPDAADRSYYFKVIYDLVKLGLIPDPEKPEYAKGFDYNRVIDVASSQKAAFFKENDALKQTEIKFDDPEMTKALAGHTYILSGKLSATKMDEPAIELNGTLSTLTPKYYSNDRAACVSGYNPSHLYGPWNAFVDEFVDAALNIELFKANTDVAKMYDLLAKRYEKGDKKKHDTFRENYDLYKFEADTQKDVIFKYLWNEELGMIFNYSNYIHAQRTFYPFASSAYTIWAGLFDIEKDNEVKMLMRLIDYITENLEGPAGYFASGLATGLAWDKPYIWPIHQGMIVSGLRRYAKKFKEKGMTVESEKFIHIADRISLKYLFANFKDWIGSRRAGALNLNTGNGNIITGFKSGANYTWNLAAVSDLHANLTNEAKKIFNDYVITIGLAGK